MKVCRRLSLVVVLLAGMTLATPGEAGLWLGARAEAGVLGSPGALLQAESGAEDQPCPEEPAPGNLLSPDVSAMENSIDGWSDGGNAGLAQSTEQAADGVASLELTALDGGTVSAQTAGGADGVEVATGYTYIASAQVRANHKLRQANVTISWFGPDGEPLGASSASGVPEVAGEWAVASHTAAAPMGAAYAGMAVTVTGAFHGEKHYVDAATFEAPKQDPPVCEPEDGDGGSGDGEPNPDEGGGNGGDGHGNNNGGNGGDGHGNNGNGTGDNGVTGTGGESPGAGGHHGSGTDTSGGHPSAGHGPGGPEVGGRGAATNPGGKDPTALPSTPAADLWHPDGTYSTGSLMTAALRLKALGWSEEEISKKVFAPFILGGEAGWTETWGAPRSGGRTHEGQDVFCNYGDPVLAPEHGAIEFDEGGLGGRVARLHRPDGSYWYYAHLSDWNTRELSSGDAVAPGDVIGYCGNTGNAISTPPHVHFSLYTATGNAVNPMDDLVGWLQVAQKRTLGFVEKITDRRVLEIDRLTSARRFGDAFIPTPSDETGSSTDFLLASRSSRMFSALEAALSESGADLEATDSAGDLVDPELLHFKLWLTSNELPGLGPVLPVSPAAGP